METNLQKLSDDELFQRLSLAQSRLVYAGNSAHGGSMVRQLQHMIEIINMTIKDRMEKADFEQRILSKPSTVDIDGPKEKQASDNANSRAKTKSEIITRLRRTSTPTSVTDTQTNDR